MTSDSAARERPIGPGRGGGFTDLGRSLMKLGGIEIEFESMAFSSWSGEVQVRYVDRAVLKAAATPLATGSFVVKPLHDPADPEDLREDALASLFGAFSLRANTLNFSTEEKTGAPSRMTMEGEVKIESDRLTIECERLEIDFEAGVMTATPKQGEAVRVLRGEIEGEAGRVLHDFGEQRTTLEKAGGIKPRISQETPEGRGTSSRANRIIIAGTPPDQSLQFEGEFELSVEPKRIPPGR